MTQKTIKQPEDWPRAKFELLVVTSTEMWWSEASEREAESGPVCWGFHGSMMTSLEHVLCGA